MQSLRHHLGFGGKTIVDMAGQGPTDGRYAHRHVINRLGRAIRTNLAPEPHTQSGWAPLLRRLRATTAR